MNAAESTKYLWGWEAVRHTSGGGEIRLHMSRAAANTVSYERDRGERRCRKGWKRLGIETKTEQHNINLLIIIFFDGCLVRVLSTLQLNSLFHIIIWIRTRHTTRNTIHCSLILNPDGIIKVFTLSSHYPAMDEWLMDEEWMQYTSSSSDRQYVVSEDF